MNTRSFARLNEFLTRRVVVDSKIVTSSENLSVMMELDFFIVQLVSLNPSAN